MAAEKGDKYLGGEMGWEMAPTASLFWDRATTPFGSW